ncbi:methyl-accepting chemotaxis protein [Aeromonas sp. BIGb0405]|uniref:methyl-accepting chemotaxis protein n=1 Tax=Aeromonas sp. BIGb0405 TaxID=2940592 RepID=UPI00216A5F3E|nr:methyl-accepting chemotaxis protein [Aeromonas sp. BIGb0405]MCS3456963.1 methyl-accepting chemotaxis protein [Aeromonas sp. BIGb0405]
MTLLNNLSFTTKLRVPILMVLLIMSAVMAVAYRSFSEQQRINRTVTEQILPVQNALEDAYRDLYQIVAAGQGLIVGGITERNLAFQHQEFIDNSSKARARLADVQGLIGSGLLGAEHQASLDLMLAEFDRWLPHYGAVFAHPQSASNYLATHFDEAERQFSSIRKQLNLLKEAVTLSRETLMAQSQASSQHAQQLMSLGTLAAVLFAIGLTWCLTRLMLQPLRNMQQALANIADGEGDLTQRLSIHSRDEIGALGTAFNRFISRVHQIVGDVSQTVVAVQSASTQLHELMTKMVDNGLSQQQQSDQIAAAVEEQSATSGQMMAHARQTASASSEAAQQVQSASEDLHLTVTALEALVLDIQASEQGVTRLEQDVVHISTVLAVIRGIAEQTNLLALNAAIEAARAGEQGRGFAVVADEVRNLASKTQHSTGEIQQMIERLQQGSQLAVQRMGASSKQSHQVVAQAHQTRANLGQMSQAIVIINQMNDQIRVAAHEQSEVSGEINQNLQAVASNGRAMLTGLEQVRLTCAQLGEQSQQLAITIRQFRL